MNQFWSLATAAARVVSAALLAGCSSSNTESPFPHPADLATAKTLHATDGGIRVVPISVDVESDDKSMRLNVAVVGTDSMAAEGVANLIGWDAFNDQHWILVSTDGIHPLAMTPRAEFHNISSDQRFYINFIPFSTINVDNGITHICLISFSIHSRNAVNKTVYASVNARALQEHCEDRDCHVKVETDSDRWQQLSVRRE